MAGEKMVHHEIVQDDDARNGSRRAVDVAVKAGVIPEVVNHQIIIRERGGMGPARIGDGDAARFGAMEVPGGRVPQVHIRRGRTTPPRSQR